MARVLIGIPTWNRPEFVKATIRSVVSQAFTDWRAIVSDNASAHPAREAVRAFVAELGDRRVTFHQQPHNEGEYGQGRYFFAQAQADRIEYLVMLHDDDVMEPSLVEAAAAALDRHEDMAFFVCNPCIITAEGKRADDLTRSFDRKWGRTEAKEGPIDVLSSHMRSGFTPISGAFFRISALEGSGFVDDDLHGCFPFESNVFLRLGERGARAWFDPRRLLGFRWHSQQMRYWGFLDSEDVVYSTIRLFERRRFEGYNERRRRQLLGRLHRTRALLRARAGDGGGARRAALSAIRSNPVSVRTWMVAPATLVAPSLVGVVERARSALRAVASL